MKNYIGTKFINATPMSLGEYNIHRGWEIPADENPDAPGYLVQYQDGYISWSPQKQFEEAYQSTDAMAFSSALAALKNGRKVARAGWNGKNMFIALMPGLKLPPYSTQEPGPKVNDRTAKFIGEDTPLDSQPYIAMKTATGQWQPGWLCSQADMLADDWCIVR